MLTRTPSPRPIRAASIAALALLAPLAPVPALAQVVPLGAEEAVLFEAVRLPADYLDLPATRPQPVEDPVDLEPDLAPFGSKGSRRLNLYAGGGTDVEGENPYARAGLAVEYFVAENLGLELGVNGVYIQQDPDEESPALGGGFDLLLRWHFIAEDTHSVYLDGGAGMLFTNHDVPASGTSYNFTPQAGLGATFDVGDRNRLILGAKWYHISNAQTGENNPGRDNWLAYAGLSVPF